MSHSIVRVCALTSVFVVSCGAEDVPTPIGEYYDVDYARGVFVAVGGVSGEGARFTRGVIVTSTDGSAWTPRLVDGPSWFSAVTHGDTAFVAVGHDAYREEKRGAAYWSADGTTWQQAQPEVRLSQVTWGKGMFLGIGPDGMFTSRDGASWISVTPTFDGGGRFGGSTIALTFADDVFLYCSDSACALSTDGTTWETHDVGEELDFKWVAPDADGFVGGVQGACDDACAAQGIVQSPDGVTWPTQSLDFARTPTGFVSAKGVRLLTMYDGMLREEGGQWVDTLDGKGAELYAVAAGDPGFVAVGLGSFASSADGRTWKIFAAPTPPAP